MSSCFAIKGFEIPEELYTACDITECWCHIPCDTDVMLCYTHHLLNRGASRGIPVSTPTDMGIPI